MTVATRKTENKAEKRALQKGDRIPVPAEQRVFFHNISWQGYEKILEILGDDRAAILSYDRGTLEITMPSEKHENTTRMIEKFIRNLVFELGMKVKTMGSTTLNYPELEKGSEPDNCYYIQNQPLVAGKEVDLKTDPPPDLVVEVDITYTNIDKPRLYAGMKVPELWRYNGEVLRIYQLQDFRYVEVENSPTFPDWVSGTKLYEFMEAAIADEMDAERDLRSWIQQQVRNG